jgi:hypothetical protein
LFAGDNPYIRLSKLSEYAAAGRPMIAFCAPGSETARHALNYGAKLAPDADLDALAKLIGEVMRERCEPSLEGFSFHHPHPLNRRTEAQQLATILNNLTAEPPPA